MKLNKVKIENFRKFKNIKFNLGKRITVVSGVNGIGKSSLVALLSSIAGERNHRLNGIAFQPEFRDYFEISKAEPFEDYRVLIDTDEKIGKENYPLTERISFNNYIKSNRAIRPIPRVCPPIDTEEWGNIKLKKVREDSHSNSGRLHIPTIYLSLARLMPPVESDQESEEITDTDVIKKKGYADFYTKCYNAVLYESIDYDEETSMFLKKHVGKNKGQHQKQHLFVEIKNSTSRTISAGQDTLGSIIAALTDFYALKDKLKDNYKGGLLCIDEIDATLHPSAVYKLMELLKEEAEKLDLQIILTTHSLTVLRWIINQEDEKQYKLIYFVDTNLPNILSEPSMEKIKADLFDQVSPVLTPQVKVFTEDEAGKNLFNLLLKSMEVDKDLRVGIQSLHLGGEQLIKLPELDDVFRQFLMVPDGDKSQKKPIINSDTESISEITHNYARKYTPIKVAANVVFLPSIYPPEILIYKMIEEYVEEYEIHSNFWNSLKMNSSNVNYVSQRVAEYAKISKQTKYKDIHENKEWLEFVINFINDSCLIKDYIKNGKGAQYLKDFYKQLHIGLTAVVKSRKKVLFDE